jgi:hypothetical protein
MVHLLGMQPLLHLRSLNLGLLIDRIWLIKILTSLLRQKGSIPQLMLLLLLINKQLLLFLKVLLRKLKRWLMPYQVVIIKLAA